MLYTCRMNFLCPYCHHHTTITAPHISDEWRPVEIGSKQFNDGQILGVGFTAIACPNPDCRQLTLTIRLTQRAYREEADDLREWRLLPESSAKPQPDYIPAAVTEDYTEACRIKDLSPKAAASLARRCLQGMIRDFHGIRKGRLADEIDELKGRIPDSEWKAIDALRSVGNIGAHMEKDVNLIIDIEPDEADKLLMLVEYLFRQWYVRRHEDEANLAEIERIAEVKRAIRNESNNEMGKSE